MTFKSVSLLFCLMLAGCASSRSVLPPAAPVAYKTWYDGYYGKVNGYWARDGGFWYSQDGGRWLRDGGGHFRRSDGGVDFTPFQPNGALPARRQ